MIIERKKFKKKNGIVLNVIPLVTFGWLLSDVRNSLLSKGNNSASGTVVLGKTLQETTPLAMLFVTLLSFLFLHPSI